MIFSFGLKMDSRTLTNGSLKMDDFQVGHFTFERGGPQFQVANLRFFGGCEIDSPKRFEPSAPRD